MQTVSPTQQNALAQVAAAADELHAARERRRRAIREARRAGASLRTIAAEALLSHEEVRRICVDKTPDEPR